MPWSWKHALPEFTSGLRFLPSSAPVCLLRVSSRDSSVLPIVLDGKIEAQGRIGFVLRYSETEPTDAQCDGLFLPVGYHPLFCPCLVSPHLFQHPSLLEDPAALYPRMTPSSGDAGPSIWCPDLFCFSPHLLIAMFPTQVSSFSCLPICPKRYLGLRPLHPPSFPAVFLSQILWIPRRMQGSRSPWSFRPWGTVVELLVFEGPAAFDFLGVQKWGLWWENPQIPQRLLVPSALRMEHQMLPLSLLRVPMTPSELVQAD